MRTRFFRIGAVVLACAGLAAAERPQTTAASPPRLIVLLAVDQMRADYIEAYGAQWSGGLAALAAGGARFMGAAYPYLNTVTCPGHATIGTGAFPRTHGIVLNSWFDRPTGSLVDCMGAAGERAIRYGAPQDAGPGYGPGNLLVPTFTDELRAQSTGGDPRIVSLAVKARAAVALAGRRADAVVWVDGGTLTSSTFYAAAPVPAVSQFVEHHPPATELSQDWARLLPADRYLHADDGLGERAPRGWATTFPHAIGALPEADAGRRPGLWAASPLVDEYLGRLASHMVGALELGQREATDVLAMSFSSLDSVGHAFGPRSHEVQDALLRIDRVLGQLFQTLDERVGRDRYVVALGADHGVAPIPEQTLSDGLSAGRVPPAEVAEAISQALAPRLGEGPHVVAVNYTDVYLTSEAAGVVRTDAASRQAVAQALAGMPGVARVLWSADLAALTATDDPFLAAARLSYRPGRSGDLIVVPEPFWLFSSGATTHGTLYGYDQHVPVIFYGAGIRPGEYWDEASPADIAPTLAALAGFTMAAPDGRVLGAALARGR